MDAVADAALGEVDPWVAPAPPVVTASAGASTMPPRGAGELEWADEKLDERDDDTDSERCMPLPPGSAGIEEGGAAAVFKATVGGGDTAGGATVVAMTGL